MPLPEEGSITEYQTLAEFRYQLRRFLRFSEQTARTAGLEPQQHQLLLAVKGLPQGRKATIGTLADQRRVLVNLTPQGEEMLRKLSLAHQAELRLVGSELVQSLNTLLKDMNY